MRALSVAGLLVVAFSYAPSGRFATGEPEAPRQEAPLTCTIFMTGRTVKTGESPKIQVRIKNETKRDILLLPSLDASDCKYRFPHCYFEVLGPDGKSAVRPTARCGNMTPLVDEDFVLVPARASFDPFVRRENVLTPTPHQLDAENFQRPGEYRIRFVYSTEEPKVRPWLGDRAEKEAGKLVGLLDRVPKTKVTSNVLRVKVVRP